MDQSTDASGVEGAGLVEKGYWKVTPLLMLATILRAIWILVIPPIVIAGVLPANILTIPIAVLGYCLLLWDAGYGTFRRVRVIYDPAISFEPDVQDRLTPADWERKAKFVITSDLVKAYVYFAYAFALAYALLSRIQPHAFSTRLGVGTAFYFSIITIATVGYGDIAPISATARAMVTVEILLGLIYAVLVFSVIASYLQARPPSA